MSEVRTLYLIKKLEGPNGKRILGNPGIEVARVSLNRLEDVDNCFGLEGEIFVQLESVNLEVSGENGEEIEAFDDI